MRKIEDTKTGAVAAAVLVAISYAVVMGFMLFRNNANAALLTASFFDSGSLLLNYIQLLDLGKFNQSLMYHTSIYGWPGNNITLWILSLSSAENFEARAVISRSISFVFSLAAIVAMGFLLHSRGQGLFASVIALLFMVTWAPFAIFSYEIHPEAFGMFFGIACLVACSAYSKRAKPTYLYVAWGAAIFAFLSKQPFLLFIAIPALLGLRECFASQQPYRFFFRTAVMFVVVGLLVVAVSNPYIFLDFGGFIEKQRAIHTHHLNISTTVAYSIARWAEIGTVKDPWFALAVLISCLAILRSDDRFIKACAWSILLFLVVLVLAMKFFFNRSYLYPVLPVAIILIGEAPRLLDAKLGRTISVALAVGAVVLVSHNVIRTAGTIKIKERFADSVPARTMLEFSGRADKQTTVLYSASLPLDGEKFKLAHNNFLVPAATMEEEIRKLMPDLIIVDRFWKYSDQALFAQAASVVKMDRYVITRRDRILSCGYQQTGSFSDCLKILIGTDYPEGEITYDVYVKPSRRDLVEGIHGLHR